MKLIAVSAIALLSMAPALAKPAHPCAADAREKALALLKLHGEVTEPYGAIGDTVKNLPPVRALKGKGKFDVLEVTGYIYKAQYRIRMIYAQIPDSCLLMGQEVLEIANPY